MVYYQVFAEQSHLHPVYFWEPEQGMPVRHMLKPQILKHFTHHLKLILAVLLLFLYFTSSKQLERKLFPTVSYS